MTKIETIGVCGAGTMGAQLAALFASAGMRVHLLDLKPELAEKGLAAALAAKPAAFYLKRFAKAVTPGGYDDHLPRVEECDWVIEAIAERLEWKLELYDRLVPHLGPEALLTSNTSGLGLADLTAGLGADLRRRFLITHFFNPPRYMRLVEIVAGEATDPAVRQALSRFISETLGKGVVAAKDTPNFIANRIGIFGMMLALKLTREMNLSVEQVDAITGPVMGRPKSATYRTADLVGLDVLATVARTSYEQCPDDESRQLVAPPPLLDELIERGRLGQKAGGGFYRKEGKEILALDLEKLEYRPRTKPRMAGIGVARRFTDMGARLHALVHNPDPAGRFAWELTIGCLAYAARRLGEIADSVAEIDQAMRWGFGWELGPFEVWDAIGVEKSARRMDREGKPVPALVQDLLGSGDGVFYSRDDQGRRMVFDRAAGEASVLPEAPGVVALADRKAAGGEILRNWSASLVDLGDGVGCLEFHSALQPLMNPLDGAILDLARAALERAAAEGMTGLVVSHDGTHFCAGANLALILELARAGRFDVIEGISREFQQLSQLIKYSELPVVAAPFSLCLGGGFEMVAPCRQIVALAELYCGAVEVGVGLIPGGGGTLRLLTHWTERLPPRRLGPMVPTQKAFETIAFAKVSGSAHEAKALGYLRPDNRIVLSREHQIGLAKEMVLTLADGYTPPAPPELVPAGPGGRLAVESVVDGLLKAGKISAHDARIGRALAGVVTGGERGNGLAAVDEQYLLDLEREVFVSLAGEALSQQRMAHMLKTGKPLRN